MVNPAVAAAFNRGNALAKAGDLNAAVSAYDEALAVAPDLAPAHLNRAQTLRRLDRMEEALEGLRRAAALEPDNVTGLSILAGALMEQRRPDDAIPVFDRLATLRPDSAAVQANRATALRMARRTTDAIAGYETALRLDPYLEIQPLLAACELALGRFEAGWRHYEQRREISTRYATGGFDAPLWLGDVPAAGQTVLVHAEQGLGDTILFCRYLSLLQQAGARVLFAPQKPLRRLMAGLDVELVDADDPGLHFDLHTRLLSLPLVFKTTVETIPALVPYLAAEPARVAAWAQRLGAHGLKIGVSWQGSAEGVQTGRAFAPADLKALATLPGVRLIGLQTGDANCPPSGQRELGIEVLDGLDADGAFLDTAAVIELCDLVIACDSAVANLAGALNRPVWIALSRHSDWRWLTDRQDTPWYPSARLFRQTVLDEWRDVFEAMAAALSSMVKAAPEASP